MMLALNLFRYRQGNRRDLTTNLTITAILLGVNLLLPPIDSSVADLRVEVETASISERIWQYR